MRKAWTLFGLDKLEASKPAQENGTLYETKGVTNWKRLLALPPLNAKSPFLSHIFQSLSSRPRPKSLAPALFSFHLSSAHILDRKEALEMPPRKIEIQFRRQPLFRPDDT